MDAAPALPRSAATLVVVRDAPGGMELLLLRRAEKGDHNSGAWVFPGGLVDKTDAHCHTLCDGLDDAAASRTLGMPQGGLDLYVAAIRECFEEAGVLFAHHAQGHAMDVARLQPARAPLARGELAFANFCSEFALRLQPAQLHYIAHWLTPAGRAKRFDTRFFVAVLPPGQSSTHDAVETVDQIWLRPATALAPENTRRLMTPTRAVIEEIGRHADTAALLAWAHAPRQVQRVLPRLGVDGNGPRPVMPDEAAWAEIGRLDPNGRGDVWCALRTNVAVRLSQRLWRVSAANGANSHIVTDTAGSACALIGPASADEEHITTLLAAAPGPVTHILLTDAGETQRLAAAALQARIASVVVLDAANATELAIGTDTHLRPLPHATGCACQLVEEQTLIGHPMPPPTNSGALWLAPTSGFLLPLPTANTEPTP